MRVGYVQFNPVYGRKQANLDRVAGFLDGTRADLVVLPELFATGYVFGSREELLEAAEDTAGETFARLAELSRACGTAIVAGIAEREGDRCFNSCFVFARGEILGCYRKIHLFDREKELFAPGDRGFTVVDLGGVRLGLMICFDWIFPEAARILTLMGAQILCHPANLVLPHCPQAMITRCLENRVYAVTANRVGTEVRDGEEYRFIGTSQVVSPRGQVLVRAGDDELVQIIDVDPALADDKMVTSANHAIGDRRPDLYCKLTEPSP
ncbi:MAG: nitrilase-related carbon-nitrogen hydrolase [bacterium]